MQSSASFTVKEKEGKAANLAVLCSLTNSHRILNLFVFSSSSVWDSVFAGMNQLLSWCTKQKWGSICGCQRLLGQWSTALSCSVVFSPGRPLQRCLHFCLNLFSNLPVICPRFSLLSPSAPAHKGVYLICAGARLHLPLSHCTVLASMWASPRKPGSGVSNTANALQWDVKT